MNRKYETVCKFVVVDPSGRRSSEWRVWTGREDRPPKDDVYLAPVRSIKEFHISLHRDNMAQYGLTNSVRARIRPGDRHAPLRWEMDLTEITPGWRPGYILRFPEQELEKLEACSNEAVQIPSGITGSETVVLIAIGKPGATLKSDSIGTVVALLDREDGGKVAMIAIRRPFDESTFAELDDRGSSFGWALPTLVTDNDPFGWVVHNHGGTRASTEFSALKHSVDRSLVSLRGFAGEVFTIDECASEINHQDSACAVLVCGPEGHSIYVDERARCSHAHLAADATRLVESYENGTTNHCWGEMSDGRLHTMIGTQRVVDERGIGPWARVRDTQPR